MRASNQTCTHGFVSGFMYVVTLCAQLRVELHVFSRATTRQMTTPGVVRGLHPETCVPSAKISFFTSRMILGKLYTAVRSRTARSFPRVGASCSRVHSWAVVRSHVQRREHGHDTRVRRAVHGAVRSTGPVSFYRIAMSFPRVRDLEFSRCESPRLARLQRDDARRGDACIIDQVKTSSIILQSTTSTLLPIRARARA